MNSELAEIYTDAERALASCVLAHGTPQVVHAVRPEQIGDPTARTIVETAAELLAEGTHPDPVTVGLRLAFARRDWPLRVFEVYEYRGTIWANWRTYAVQVVEGDYRRSAIAAATRIAQAAQNIDLDSLTATLAAAREVTL